jgi:hypothetical protein
MRTKALKVDDVDEHAVISSTAHAHTRWDPHMYMTSACSLGALQCIAHSCHNHQQKATVSETSWALLVLAVL